MGENKRHLFKMMRVLRAVVCYSVPAVGDTIEIEDLCETTGNRRVFPLSLRWLLTHS